MLQFGDGDDEMNQKRREEELRRLEDLCRAGISLDARVVEDLKNDSRGLSIFQPGNPAEDQVFDLDRGGSGCTFGVAIHNDSDGVICLQQYQLLLPWHEPNFRWLKNSRRDSAYSFPPGGPCGFDSEDILNHRLGTRGRLNPGESLEGLFLGIGQADIPKEFRNGQAIPVKFTIFDQHGDEHTLELIIRAFRQKPVWNAQRKAITQRVSVTAAKV
jgi:hypothetical protein